MDKGSFHPSKDGPMDHFPYTTGEEDFMKTAKDILEEYENADMARRLHLYLQHRDAFLLVDMKRSGAKAMAAACWPTHEEGRSKGRRTRWRKFFIHAFACR